MPETIKQARSGIDPANLQEVLDASASAKQATLTGQQQYETPAELVEVLNSLLPEYPNTIFDPQCASGKTLRHGVPHWTKKFGCELDNRFKYIEDGVNRVVTNCVKFWDILDDVFPDLEFECQVANPPFGIWWPLLNESRVDSTEYTWRKIMERAAPGGYGWFVANWKTIERLGIHKHERAYLYQKFPVGVWKNCEVEIGVVHWHNTRYKPEWQALEYKTLDYAVEHADELEDVKDFYSDSSHPKTFVSAIDMEAAFTKIKEIVSEEKRNQPNFNIWLDNGKLKTYLSTRTQVKRKLTRDEIHKLTRVNDSHPLTLTTDRETRKILDDLLNNGIYTIQPEAKAAMQSALSDVVRLSVPLMPVTDFERVAYADEEDALLCIEDFKVNGKTIFTKGKHYDLTTATYNFTDKFKRNKLKYSELANQMYTETHDCTLSGTDRYIQIVDDKEVAHRFMDRPTKDLPTDHEESLLWTIFQKPEVKTVAEVCSDQIEKNILTFETCEMLADYTYYPGQKYYLARVGTKDYGLIGGDTGTGKSLMALSLIQAKGPQRALIIAPQGTLRSSEEDDDEEGETEYQASQWVQELRRFAPGMAVFELFSMDDYRRILTANNGTLPCGVYISYYQAMFLNGARERVPETWDDSRLAAELEMELPKPPEEAEDPETYWCKTVGNEVEGIRCIIAPCMATQIGHHFDMVCLDEAHFFCNLGANCTQMLIRMQPRYRYAFTATPIPNVVSNLFSLMGWLCVHDWYKGDRRNAAWPYARNEIGKFTDTFQSVERDLTQEKINQETAREKKTRWSGKCEKVSPIISSPARLLKLLKPSMAYISKRACNPNIADPKITEVRVPMGVQQSKLYGHFMNRGNIKAKSALVRARKQIAYLRNICADPAGFGHGGPRVLSNFNPKTIAILEILRELISKGEQCVVICARIGQTNTIASRLKDAGVSVSRIDSTILPEQHSYQSNLFKREESQVHLMGIKCAVGHSYSHCPNEIIGSLEYSFGALHQAKGRVDRVNSKYQPNIYCVLHKSSLEETMFDVCATKQDSATICLQGCRVARDFKPVDMGEVMALSLINWQNNQSTINESECECESQWPKLRDAIKKSL